MKLSELKKPAKSAAPVSPRAANSEPDAVASAPQEPQGVTSVTPSGIEIAYEWAPRRLYRLRDLADSTGQTVVDVSRDDPDYPWREVPSVTTVLGVLDKSGALSWWAQRQGIEGVLELLKRNVIQGAGSTLVLGPVWDGVSPGPTSQEIVDLLVAEKLSINHVKDKAADRGVNVHGALEQWCNEGTVPEFTLWPEHERGYIEGLCELLLAFESAGVDAVNDTQTELMVGSLEHQYAGRFDLVLTLSKPVEVVTRVYPKKPPRIEEIPAGRYLLDLKTSKRVYDTHYLQLEAYEAAAVECGYAPTDYRGVVHVTEDGRYELALNMLERGQGWCFEDFLAVRKVYQVMNEREVLRILREDLDAQEVK